MGEESFTEEESPDSDVIKVTIRPMSGRCITPLIVIDDPVSEISSIEEASLRGAFAALRLHALQEHRLRDLANALDQRRGRRLLRRCLNDWREWAARERRRAQQRAGPERKIELLVGTIGERQKALRASAPVSAPAASRPSADRQKVAQRSATKTAKPSSANDVLGGPAHNRLRAQRRIIEEQRTRLLEQTRLIQELKLRQIEEEAKRASQLTIGAAKAALECCEQQTTTRRSLVHLMREEGCR